MDVKRKDAKLIAEACSDAADKALFWKQRALGARDALRCIKGMTARDAGGQSILGDIHKIADAELSEPTQ